MNTLDDTQPLIRLYSRYGESVLLHSDRVMFANDGVKTELFTLGNHLLARLDGQGRWVVSSNRMWGWCWLQQERTAPMTEADYTRKGAVTE